MHSNRIATKFLFEPTIASKKQSTFCVQQSKCSLSKSSRKWSLIFMRKTTIISKFTYLKSYASFVILDVRLVLTICDIELSKGNIQIS